MKARFELRGMNQTDLVVEPESRDERLLLAVWLRYDANSFSASVDRLQNAEIERVRLTASEAS